jgi:fatty acid/phospholipid biosynthesis enzyme
MGALEVVDAEETVSNDEPAALALRRRPRAAIRVAADLVAAGHADALVSAGHTGATVVSARAAFGMIPASNARRSPPSFPLKPVPRCSSTPEPAWNAGRRTSCSSR